MDIKIFDSHAHYDDESFNDDRIKVLEDIKSNGVIGVLNCGASMDGARQSVELSKKYEMFYAAVGIHPEYANEINDETIKELEKLATFKKVKAIGEIGLDYYWDTNPSREVQKYAFRKQIQLAEKLNLPIVIHDRDAHEDTLNIIKEFPKVKGVVHCFSGSVEFARECLNLGYYIGFTGVITFKKAKKIIEVAKEVPIHRILVETDCPYMSPEPFRGKRNQSDYIKYIIEKLAEIKGIKVNDLNSQIILNTKKLLNLN